MHENPDSAKRKVYPTLFLVQPLKYPLIRVVKFVTVVLFLIAVTAASFLQASCKLPVLEDSLLQNSFFLNSQRPYFHGRTAKNTRHRSASEAGQLGITHVTCNIFLAEIRVIRQPRFQYFNAR